MTIHAPARAFFETQAAAPAAIDVGDKVYQLALLAALRAAHGRVPQEVQSYILGRTGFKAIDRRRSRAATLSRVAMAVAVAVAVICAPLALLAALAALGQPGGETAAPTALLLAGGVGLTPDFFGYAAAGVMLLTFCMAHPVLLRLCAILANICFIAYALTAGLQPVLVLHATLLPLNTYHLVLAITGTVREAARFRRRLGPAFAT